MLESRSFFFKLNFFKIASLIYFLLLLIRLKYRVILRHGSSNLSEAKARQDASIVATYQTTRHVHLFSTRLIVANAETDLIVVNELEEDEARSRLRLFTSCKVHRVHIVQTTDDA